MGPGELKPDEKCILVFEVSGAVDAKKVEEFNKELKALLDKFKKETYTVEKRYVIRGKRVTG